MLIVVAAALLMTGNASGLYREAEAPGGVVAGMTDASVLLIEILR
ncbi:MAG TPA: hypothetical protein VMU64_13410 [Acidimicrobiales bacterium]|nr:hypothetical protein [Acidimicrobiales bacterium]